MLLKIIWLVNSLRKGVLSKTYKGESIKEKEYILLH